MKSKSLILIGTALLAGCATVPGKPRWEMPNGPLSYRPICTSYAAPLLGTVPEGGLVPAVLFAMNGASADEESAVRSALASNSLVVADGTVTINDTKILFAAGEGRVRSQKTADALYNALCRAESERIRLVHMRYNLPSEANRMN